MLKKSCLSRLLFVTSKCHAITPPVATLIKPNTENSLKTPLVNSVRTHLGYIPFEGRLGRKLSNNELFLHQLKIANVQPVKKATFTFDPMREDYQSIREFTYFWHMRKVLDTNKKIITRVDVVDDRREPTILFNLNDGRDLEIKTGNLSLLEIARIVNYYLLPMVKEEEVAVVTKATKGAGAKASAKRRK